MNLFEKKKSGVEKKKGDITHVSN